MAMTHSLATLACHNCRRRRWKCDRSLPKCQKCFDRNQECPGYPGQQQLFIWEKGMASRGKLRDKTTFAGISESSNRNARYDTIESPFQSSFPNVPAPYQQYVAHFVQKISKDLVLYDGDDGINHFRQLIPLAFSSPALLQIIIASAATSMARIQGRQHEPSHRSSNRTISEHETVALTTKQNALQLLVANLGNLTTITSIDAILATVLLFIRLELYNVEGGDSKHHINGARSIIQTLIKQRPPSTGESLPLLQRTLISNCLIFDIAASIMTPSSKNNHMIEPETRLLVPHEDSNHCSSFPLTLLRLAQAGAQLLFDFDSDLNRDLSNAIAMHEKACNLISTAKSFDPEAWATEIQQSSPRFDLEARKKVAVAYRAALCIYLSRVHQLIDKSCELPLDRESLVGLALQQVAQLSPRDPLSTAVAWPVFIAGLETKDPMVQKSVEGTLTSMMGWESWGMLQGAIDVSKRIWTIRQRATEISQNQNDLDWNWITEIRDTGMHWLII